MREGLWMEGGGAQNDPFRAPLQQALRSVLYKHTCLRVLELEH